MPALDGTGHRRHIEELVRHLFAPSVVLCDSLVDSGKHRIVLGKSLEISGPPFELGLAASQAMFKQRQHGRQRRSSQ